MNTPQEHSAGQRPVPPFPTFVLLEATNACNLRCRMCFIYGEGVSAKRETGFLKEEIWRPAIDEIGSRPETITLDLHGAGEPLLHPQLFDIISHAKGKGNIKVGFLSNATLLDREKARRVIESGLDWIGFSVDGAQKEIFDYYRKGASLEEVEANIEHLLSLRKNGPTVYLNMVLHEEADKDLFIQRWKGKVETLLLSVKRINDKSLNTPIVFQKPCHLLYEQLIMGWDGTAVLCCEDYYGEYIAGKFPEQSIQEIWLGSALSGARRLHETGKARSLRLCSLCDSVAFHEYDEKVMDKEGKTTIVREELSAVRPSV